MVHFLRFSPSAGLGRTVCTVALGAAGSQGSVAESVEAHVPGKGHWKARQGIGQRLAATHSHNPLRPSHLNQFKNTWSIFIFVLFHTSFGETDQFEVVHMCMLVCMHTVVEVELCYRQQDSGKWQVRAEPTKKRLNAWERSVDQWGVFYTHTVQDTHRLHQALEEETGQTQ